VVGIGSAVYSRGVLAMQEIGAELVNFMEEQGIESIAEMRERGQ
jgi:dihydroorotate dehydrogenase